MPANVNISLYSLNCLFVYCLVGFWGDVVLLNRLIEVVVVGIEEFVGFTLFRLDD